MAECCYSGEYATFFSEREARRTARRFLRRALRGSARDLADAVSDAGVGGATILEAGRGVGDIQVELLRRRAAGATNVELSPSWEKAGAGLLAETAWPTGWTGAWVTSSPSPTSCPPPKW